MVEKNIYFKEGSWRLWVFLSHLLSPSPSLTCPILWPPVCVCIRLLWVILPSSHLPQLMRAKHGEKESLKEA